MICSRNGIVNLIGRDWQSRGSLHWRTKPVCILLLGQDLVWWPSCRQTADRSKATTGFLRREAITPPRVVRKLTTGCPKHAWVFEGNCKSIPILRLMRSINLDSIILTLWMAMMRLQEYSNLLFMSTSLLGKIILNSSNFWVMLEKNSLLFRKSTKNTNPTHLLPYRGVSIVRL